MAQRKFIFLYKLSFACSFAPCRFVPNKQKDTDGENVMKRFVSIFTPFFALRDRGRVGGMWDCYVALVTGVNYFFLVFIYLCILLIFVCSPSSRSIFKFWDRVEKIEKNKKKY